MTFAKIVLTSPRLIKRVKKNNGVWCPAISGGRPLINEVPFEAREEQLDRLCDANGGAFEDAELRGLVRTIIYLESIKPTTCSIEQKIKRKYDRELENTTVSADKDKCFHELFIYFQSLFQLHNLTANSRAEKDALSSPLFPWGVPALPDLVHNTLFQLHFWLPQLAFRTERMKSICLRLLCQGTR